MCVHLDILSQGWAVSVNVTLLLYEAYIKCPGFLSLLSFMVIRPTYLWWVHYIIRLYLLVANLAESLVYLY